MIFDWLIDWWCNVCAAATADYGILQCARLWNSRLLTAARCCRVTCSSVELCRCLQVHLCTTSGHTHTHTHTPHTHTHTHTHTYTRTHTPTHIHIHLWSCAVVYHQWRWYCPRLWPCAWSMYLGWFKPRPPCVRRQFGVLLLATRGSIKWGAQVADIETPKASSGRELGRRCPRSLPTRRSGRNWEASVPVPSRLVDLGESWLRQPSPGRSLDHKTPFQQFLSVTESVRWKENAILLFIS